MATVTVNGTPVTIDDGERLNLIQAAQRIGVEVPHYCWHPALTVVASCRMCLVEVGDKKPDGTVAMQPRVVPGCQTPAKDGTVIVTDSEKVKNAQKGTLEFLLLNHPLDCPICDQAGECFLQDYSYRFGKAESRLKEPKTLHIDKHHIGEKIVLFTDRCVMCSRCVRFTREISGTGELQVINRGGHSEIDIFPGEPCNNKLAGNVVELCPVGALCSKDFLYKQRVWWLQSKPSVCTNCSTGCSINVDQNDDRVYRLKARFNPQAQGYFMCDEGRFGWKYAHSPDRLKFPQIKNRQLPADDPEGAWLSAVETVRRKLLDAESAAIVFSPSMTVEEAYVLAKWASEKLPEAELVLGPVPVVGEDDQYPKGPDGNPKPPVKFTIRGEKCPNRQGVEAVLRAVTGAVNTWADIAGGGVDAVFVVGGYLPGLLPDDFAAAVRRADFVGVLDILPNALTEAADVVLPGAAYVERDGTVVNHAGLAQLIRSAVRVPDYARQDGRVLFDLCGRRGLFNAGAVRKEIAAAHPELAALAGDLGMLGVKLGGGEPDAAAPAKPNTLLQGAGR